MIAKDLFTYASGGREVAYVARLVLALVVKITASCFESKSNNIVGSRNLLMKWI